MKLNILLTLLLASVLSFACDNSGSSGTTIGSNIVSDCREAVYRAVRNAGPDESEEIRARDKALQVCMADN